MQRQKKANAKCRKRLRDLIDFEGIEGLSIVLLYNDVKLENDVQEEPRVLSLAK